MTSTLFVAATLLTGTSYAHSFKAGDLEVLHPYATESRPGQQNGAAWFGVTNSGDTADRIVDVRSNVAKSTEIHDMTMENDIMRMFQVDGVDVPAHSTVQLGEGNKLHIMLIDLNAPLKKGEKFNLDVVFEKAGVVPVEVVVEAAKKPGAKHDHHAHDGDAKAVEHASHAEKAMAEHHHSNRVWAF